MYFSTTPFACSQAMPMPQVIPPLNVVPQIANPTGSFITDTLNWTEVSGTFTATGNEKYLTIGNFLNDAATNTVVVNPTSAYTVTYFLIDDVSLEEIIPAQAIKDSTICLNDSIILAPTSPTEFAEYNWQPATGLSCITCPSPKASPQTTTTYTLTKKHCKATTSAQVKIAVNTDCDVKKKFEIPNVFTPNEDGANDTFRIQLPIGSVLKEFNVYNRWGNVVHVTEARQQSVILWDGRTNAGEACSAGVYFYILSYVDAEGALQKKNGYITLFK
jgi:gliding motility-associated-like protein